MKVTAGKFAKDEAKMRKAATNEEDRLSSKPRKKKMRVKTGRKSAAGKRTKGVERKHRMYKC